MSNERDELAELLVNIPWRSATADRTADAILAKGYRKPYTVTTDAELDALPRLSVVRQVGHAQSVFVKYTMWHEAGSRDLCWSNAIPLPATVLHVGEGEE